MLGSRKLLIFALVSALVFALVIVGVSAEDRVFNDPALRSLADPVYTFTTSQSALDTLYDFLSNNGYVSVSSALAFSDLYNIPSNTTISGLYATSGKVYQVLSGASYPSPADRVWGFDNFSTLDFFVNEVGLSATLFESSGEDYVFGGMLPLFGSIIAIGSALVTFVTSNTIVLIPIVAMVFVLGYGVIRRLIKGV